MLIVKFAYKTTSHLHSDSMIQQFHETLYQNDELMTRYMQDVMIRDPINCDRTTL